jgi:hypothetical protein
MVEFNAMIKKKDELRKEAGERPLPGIITTTEPGPLRGTPQPKTIKQKGKDSN